MERREPTFTPGTDSSSQSPSTDARRQAPPDRQTRGSSAPKPAVVTESSGKSSFALVLALLALAGAGFLGWQLLQAQDALRASNDRITALEEQLNVSAEGTSQSVTSLSAKLSKLNDTLTKQGITVEANRKSLSATIEKNTAQTKDIASVKQIAIDAKNLSTSLKQDVAANKSLTDASLAKLEPAVAQFDQKLSVLNEDINKVALDVGNIDAIERRLRSNEEAIKAIDDFRRTTNREILQLKQQVSGVPAK